MICIFCMKERDPSIEHIFPYAIGGRLKTDRVCKDCNSTLGSRVDSALCNFLLIRQRRADLKLAGYNCDPPGRLDWLTGDAEMVGEDGGRVRTSIDPATGKLVQTRLYTVKGTTNCDGPSLRQITIDGKEKERLPVIIQRERKRHGLPPLSDREMVERLEGITITTQAPVVIKKEINLDFDYLRHAMFKIAYELAFIWLGESYLDDPLAVEIRTAVCSDDVGACDNLCGNTDFLAACEPPFNKFWIPNQSHHLAYSNVHSETKQVAVAVRIFDIYAAIVPVSKDPKHGDFAKCGFLAQDAVTGKMVSTPFAVEQSRLVQMMMERKSEPPFPDPL
jgi:HNH endonuclease